MISPTQIAALEAAAQSWVGTPFCEGAPVKGAGVSCHHLVAEVLFESGLLPRVPVPNGPSNWRGQDRSLIAEWIEASGICVCIAQAAPGSLAPVSLLGAQPGDILGFRVGPLHHAAILLSGGRIVHSISGREVGIAPQIPAIWANRLSAIWRLKSLA